MQPHFSMTHDPVQQSVPMVHEEPMIAQVEVPFSHLSGLPAQLPAQHSSLVAQEAPPAMQVEVQTSIPAELGEQVPSQHVSPPPQGAPRGRQGPGPKAQRPLTGSQSPQHGGIEVLMHVSPVARQIDAARVHAPMPSALAHTPEQQSPSVLHELPAGVQSVGPHVPLLQPREQQSVAAVHAAPSTRQYGAHSSRARPRRDCIGRCSSRSVGCTEPPGRCTTLCPGRRRWSIVPSNNRSSRRRWRRCRGRWERSSRRRRRRLSLRAQWRR